MENKITFAQTPHSTNRLWIARTHMPQNVTQRTLCSHMLDILCVWGGADKIDDEYLSWEFSKSIGATCILKILTHFCVGTLEERTQAFHEYTID